MSIKLKIKAKDANDLRKILTEMLNTGECVTLPAARIGNVDDVVLPPVTTDDITVETPVEKVELPPEATTSTDDNTDINGHTWDKRIHSSGKSKNKDNSWKLKKKPAEYPDAETWKAYIKSILDSQTDDNVVESSNNATETPEEVFSTTDAVSEPNEPETGNAASNVPTDLASFLAFVTANNKNITTDEVLAICAKHGIPNMVAVGNYLDLLPILHAEITVKINENA